MENESAQKTKSAHSNWSFYSAIVIVIVALLACSYLIMASSDKKKHTADTAALHAKITSLQYSPITMPDSAGKYLVIFNKAILTDFNIDKSHVDQTQKARLISWKDKPEGQEYIKVQSDNGEYFSFILTERQAHQPFRLQINDNGVWSPVKTKH